MVLRVETSSNPVLTKASNFNRVSALDKWKTDWFHEISNLFTVTTDQVIGCNETCLTTHCDSSERNKYHCRMLQNRAKLNMVVSMVERYVKGTLSVETTKSDCKVQTDDLKRNMRDGTKITPWTMVNPDEVCPLNNCRKIINNKYTKKKFTAEEIVDGLSVEPDFFSLNDFDDPCDSDMDNPSALSEPCDIPDDILAQACEVINKTQHTPTALECKDEQTDSPSVKELSPPSEITTIQEPNYVECAQTEGNSVDSGCTKNVIKPVEVTGTALFENPAGANPSNILTNNVTKKIFQRCTSQSTITPRGQVFVLSPTARIDSKKVLPQLSLISTAKKEIKAEQMKNVVDIVPATLPDGRVVHLEVTRKTPTTRPAVLPAVGVKHIFIPKNFNNNVQQNPKKVSRIITTSKEQAPSQLNASISLSTNSHNRTKQILAESPNGAVQTICLKKVITPSSIARGNLAGRVVHLTTVTPELYHRLQKSNGKITIQKAVLNQRKLASSPTTGIANGLRYNVRKRNHEGEIKSEVNCNITEANDDMNDNVNTTTMQANNDKDADLDADILDELMNDLSAPQKNTENSGGSNEEDFFEQLNVDDLMSNVNSDNSADDVSAKNTVLVVESSQAFNVAADDHNTAKGNDVVPCYVNGTSRLTKTVMNSQGKIPKHCSSVMTSDGVDTKRKILCPINGNTRCVSDNSIMGIKSGISAIKIKRKYTKRNEVKTSKTDVKTTNTLGPTAAAAAKNPYIKPPLPYNILIYLAFRDAGFESLTVKQIYRFILDTFPYFRHAHPTWQNAIRHQLCCCKVYEKVPLGDGEIRNDKPAGKSAWKVLDEDCQRKLEEDAAISLQKKDVIEKTKEALSDPSIFSELFDDVLAATAERKRKISIRAREKQSILQSSIGYDTSLSEQHKPQSFFEHGNSLIHQAEHDLMELTPPPSINGQDEEKEFADDFHFFHGFTDSNTSNLFDVHTSTVDMNAIYNL